MLKQGSIKRFTYETVMLFYWMLLRDEKYNMAARDIDYSNVAVTLHLRVVECRTSGVGVVNRSGLPWKQKLQIH